MESLNNNLKTANLKGNIMKTARLLAASTLALATHAAFAGPVAEHDTQAFLNVLNSGGGKPME